MIGFYIIIGVISLLSWLVSNKLKNKFKHYSKLQLRNGMSGAEIAKKMLVDHGITDVKVISTPGMLTDHYNPKNRTVNLSEGVYILTLSYNGEKINSINIPVKNNEPWNMG